MNKILVLSLMAVLTSSNAFAASSGSCGTGCTYTLDDKGLLTVTGTGENASIKSYAFDGNLNIYDVVIKGTIKSIGTDAFHGSDSNTSNIRSVDMSQSEVETIGVGAFYHNTKLETLTFSPTLKTIEYAAFKTGYPPIKELILPEGLTTINNQAFAWMNGIEVLVIPDSVTSISTSVFDGFGLGYNNTYNEVKVYCSEAKKSLCEQAFRNSDISRNNFTNNEGTHSNLIEIKAYSKDGDFYIVDGKKYASFSDMGAGKEYHNVKRIYTVEEATEAAKGNKNTFSIKYR